MNINITNHKFSYGGNGYFLDGAHAVELGAFGKKKDQIGGKAFLEVHDQIMPTILDGQVRYKHTADFVYADVQTAALDGVLTYFGLKASGKVDKKTIETYQLKTVLLEIDEGPLEKMLNTEAGRARNFMADEGDDARVCSGVWVVVSGEVAEYIKVDGSLGITAKGDAAALNFSAGKSGAQAMTLTPNSTFAYKLHKVTNWDNNRTRVAESAPDWKT